MIEMEELVTKPIVKAPVLIAKLEEQGYRSTVDIMFPQKRWRNQSLNLYWKKEGQNQARNQ